MGLRQRVLPSRTQVHTGGIGEIIVSQAPGPHGPPPRSTADSYISPYIRSRTYKK